MEKENNFEMLDQPGKIAVGCDGRTFGNNDPWLVRRTGREGYQHDFQSYRQYDE